MVSLCRKAITTNIFYVCLIIAITLFNASSSRAATDNHSVAFNFSHSGTVSSGLISLLGFYTNTVTTPSPTLSLPQFDSSLGRLTKVTVTINTTTASFFVAPTGLLSLLSGQNATRNLSYSIAAGAASATDFNEVVTSGATLLTLLQLGGADIGGAPLAKSSQFSTAINLSAFSGNSTFTVNLAATNTLSVFTVLSLFNGAGIDGSGTYAGTVTVTYDYIPWTISGYVYKDIDHNGTKGVNEGGTGLTLYAKLLLSGNLAGPALQAAPVDPVTGAYSLPAAIGSYRILIDDNSTLSDLTPLQNSSWAQTQTINLWRDLAVGGDQVNQNFGLIQAMNIAGRIFIDDGKLSGIANDGIFNGGEIGQSGRTIRLLDNNGLVLDSITSTGDGTYRLFIPSTIVNGATLRVQLADDSAFLSTGASLGNSGGAFLRPTSIIAIPFVSFTNYVELNFGTVHVPTFKETNSKQSVLPSSVVFYRHHFVASSVGQVSFSTSHSPTQNTPPWTDIVYVDSNDNGKIDPSELPVTSTIPVSAGQSIALIVKVALPSNISANLQLQTTLRADMSFTNASPPLNYSATSLDQTETLASDSGSLSLSKSVDKDTAKPGNTLVYTITFTNTGSDILSNVVVHDQTPSHTSYSSSNVVSLPSSLTTSSTAAPAAGDKGALQWSFQGNLAPTESGSVQFSVIIDH